MKPLARRGGIVIQDFQDETLVYDLESHKAHCLNTTSAIIWKACDGNRTVSDILQHTKQELGESANEAFVKFGLDELLKEGLINDYQSNLGAVEGISRRNMIKKLGLSTAVALPIIASLIAPPAAFSQSGCVPAAMNPPGCPCVTPADCAGGNCGMTTPGRCT